MTDIVRHATCGGPERLMSDDLTAAEAEAEAVVEALRR